jgi:hypothetical protein
MIVNEKDLLNLEGVQNWLAGDTDWFDLPEATRDALYEHYTVTDPIMPYGVQKARTGDPDQWIAIRLEKLL